jgi:hypothetical protein
MRNAADDRRELPQARHPFLDASIKRMLIDGKWAEAASGKTFESLNPATGEVLAHVAEGDAEDIDRAVAAAGGLSTGRGRSSSRSSGRRCCSISPIWSSSISTS